MVRQEKIQVENSIWDNKSITTKGGFSMKQSRAKIYVQNSKNGLDIFLNINGMNHYLVTRKPNKNIWHKLKNGSTLSELRRIKPKKSKAEQKYYHSISYVLKIADSYIKHELVA